MWSGSGGGTGSREWRYYTYTEENCSKVKGLTDYLSLSVTKASLSMPYKAIRENFSRQCAIILSSYRKHCSNQSPPGQLILPESLKLLPMYANCLLKSDALLSRELRSCLHVASWCVHVPYKVVKLVLYTCTC